MIEITILDHLNAALAVPVVLEKPDPITGPFLCFSRKPEAASQTDCHHPRLLSVLRNITLWHVPTSRRSQGGCGIAGRTDEIRLSPAELRL